MLVQARLKNLIKVVLLSILLTPTSQWVSYSSFSSLSPCSNHLKRSSKTNSLVTRTNSDLSFLQRSRILLQINSGGDGNDVSVYEDQLDTEILTVKPTPHGGSRKQQQQQEEVIASPIESYFREKIFLGIEPTPEVLSIMAIYFVEGALGLARLAQTFYLKDELHLGPAELSALTGLFTLPWTIKVSTVSSYYYLLTTKLE
jgi:hypothetical protein